MISSTDDTKDDGPKHANQLGRAAATAATRLGIAFSSGCPTAAVNDVGHLRRRGGAFPERPLDVLSPRAAGASSAGRFAAGLAKMQLTSSAAPRHQPLSIRIAAAPSAVAASADGTNHCRTVNSVESILVPKRNQPTVRPSASALLSMSAARRRWRSSALGGDRCALPS